MARVVLSLMALAACVAGAAAYPQLWAQEDAPSCFSVPIGPEACHKSPVADKATGVSFLVAGKAAKTVCAGKPVTVSLAFPEPRFSYLTLGVNNLPAGRLVKANALNAKCTNTFVFSKATGLTAPTAAVSADAVAPAAPGTWTAQVASATGACAPFQIARASIQVVRC